MNRPATEAASRADFSRIRYAQCWEDADILLDALNIEPGDVCLSIASAGDNAFSMLSRGAGRVIAVDLNPAQIACVELRRAAYATLSHPELLELIGSRPSTRRVALYRQCRDRLPEPVRQFWDAHHPQISAGIGSAGKFERYFSTFRKWVIPLVHSRRRIDELLIDKPLDARHQFYDERWNTWRWRLLFRLFFSRRVMGWLGRDPAFFTYVDVPVATRIFNRSTHALRELNPADNPYLQWILTGTHNTALPHALRPENFHSIRANLDRLETRCCSIEQFFASEPGVRIDRYNLSDIFEYMSDANYLALLTTLVDHASRGARLAYWNMLVPRSCPAALSDRLHAVPGLGERLLMEDKAFFYSRFVVEEVQ